MKKLMLLSLLSLLFFSVKSQAQDIQFGIKAGVNNAHWGGKATEGFSDIVSLGNVMTMKNKTGFHIGAYAEIPVTTWLSIEPALLYSTKGQRVTQSLLDGEVWSPNVTFSNNAHYIDLPVQAKIYLNEGFYLTVGPQVSYLVDNSVRAEAGIFGLDLLDRKIDVDGRFREFDFAVSGGAGYKFSNGINLSAAYDYGVSSLDKGGSLDAYNRVLKFSLGYTF